MIYRCAKSRTEAKTDSRLQMLTAALPPESVHIKCARRLFKAPQRPATQSDADRGIPV
jgi:hypothetical protein